MDTVQDFEVDLIDLGAVSVETKGSQPERKLDQDVQRFDPAGLSFED